MTFLNSWTFLDQIVLIEILNSLTACLHQHIILFLLILSESKILCLPSSTKFLEMWRLQFRSSYSQFSVVEFIKLNIHLRLILFQFCEVESHLAYPESHSKGRPCAWFCSLVQFRALRSGLQGHDPVLHVAHPVTPSYRDMFQSSLWQPRSSQYLSQYQCIVY